MRNRNKIALDFFTVSAVAAFLPLSSLTFRELYFLYFEGLKKVQQVSSKNLKILQIVKEVCLNFGNFCRDTLRAQRLKTSNSSLFENTWVSK